jgi:hypothetical protein
VDAGSLIQIILSRCYLLEIGYYRVTKFSKPVKMPARRHPRKCKGAIGQPEVFLDNKEVAKKSDELARGLGLKTYRVVDNSLCGLAI